MSKTKFQLIPFERNTHFSISGSLLSTNKNTLTCAVHIEGPLDTLKIPKPTTPQKQEGLWASTCVELFVFSDNKHYLEWNFSPSGAWWAMSFSDYRIRSTHEPELIPNHCTWTQEQKLSCHFEVPCPFTPEKLQITCILETTDGTKTHWAPKHPKDKPDFHVF